MWLRARGQRLTRDSATAAPPAAVLHDVVGLQAQLWSAAALGLRARSAGLDTGAVNRALTDDHAIVRTWLMRGTLHVVATEDARWLLKLLGPVFARAGATRHAQLGLDDDLKARGVAAIRKILSASGPLTRYELVDRLRKQHVMLDPRTQGPIHLIAFAALQGLLCLGPDRDGGESTYVLLEDWVPSARLPSRETALAELAHRYFIAYGPATIDDLGGWSGLSMIDARAAVSGASAGLAEVRLQGQLAFASRQRLRLTPMAATTDVRLLPAFDTYLLGYRRRDLAVAPPLQRRLQRGGGWLHPVVVANGRAVGAWSLRASGRRSGRVRIETLGPIGRAVRAGLGLEVDDLSRFLDRQLTVNVMPGSIGSK